LPGSGNDSKWLIGNSLIRKDGELVMGIIAALSRLCGLLAMTSLVIAKSEATKQSHKYLSNEDCHATVASRK
jgi:hypothetical protein